MEKSGTGAIPAARRGDPGSIIGYGKDGEPWRLIAGAQDPPANDPPPTNDPPKNDPPQSDPDDLGEAGKRALAAEREARAAAETRAKDAEAKVKEFEQAKLSETERLQAQAKEHEQGKLEAQQALAGERFSRAVERAAGRYGYLDPEDAVHLIDRDAVKRDDEGKPDSQSLEAALKRLAEAKPHLVGRRPNGSGDGGARTSSPAGGDMNSLIRQAAGR